MKFLVGENPLNRSATHPTQDDDIVYSPNKYRETEGIKGKNMKVGRNICIITKDTIIYSEWQE